MKISVNLLIMFGAVALFSPISGQITVEELQETMNNAINSYDKLISETKAYKDIKPKQANKITKDIVDINRQLKKDFEGFIDRKIKSDSLYDVIYLAKETALESLKDGIDITYKREDKVDADAKREVTWDVLFVIKYVIEGAKDVVSLCERELKKQLPEEIAKQITVIKEKHGVIAEKGKTLQSILKPFAPEDYE